jgi:putative tryptophan/tyrosine transport system substrate-binding protein
MRRRDFIGMLGGAVAAPLAARAQQAAMPVVGVVNSASPQGYGAFITAFRKGLGETGFVEGQNVTVLYRYADSQYELLRKLIDELVAQRVTVLLANGPAALLAKQATTTIPVVFTAGFDPIQLGLVSSLARPGGNVTGISILSVEFAPKRLELLREIVPGVQRVGLLINPGNPNGEGLAKQGLAAGSALGLTLIVRRATTADEVAAAFNDFVRERAGGVVVGSDPFFTTQNKQLAALSMQHMLPTVYQYREFVVDGGLISYGGSLTDVYRQAGSYVGCIIKGEKPADHPVPQVTKVEMMVNLKAAKAFGVTIPLALLGRADEVIE